MSAVHPAPPPLLTLPTPEDYKQHFVTQYCRAHIYTFDGIRIHFKPGCFEHAFFTSAGRQRGDKSVFDTHRAERMDWIAWALADPTATLRQAWRGGWYDPTRRACVVGAVGYCVWVQIPVGATAFFVTAYTPEAANLVKIVGGPAY